MGGWCIVEIVLQVIEVYFCQECCVGVFFNLFGDGQYVELLFDLYYGLYQYLVVGVGGDIVYELVIDFDDVEVEVVQVVEVGEIGVEVVECEDQVGGVQVGYEGGYEVGYYYG